MVGTIKIKLSAAFKLLSLKYVRCIGNCFKAKGNMGSFFYNKPSVGSSKSIEQRDKLTVQTYYNAIRNTTKNSLTS